MVDPLGVHELRKPGLSHSLNTSFKLISGSCPKVQLQLPGDGGESQDRGSKHCEYRARAQQAAQRVFGEGPGLDTGGRGGASAGRGGPQLAFSLLPGEGG